MKAFKIIIVIIIFLFIYIFREGGILILNEKNDIYNIEEKDNNIVKKFSKGMNLTSYLSTINHNTTHLEKENNQYKNIKYDFELLNYSQIEELIIKLNKSGVVDVEILNKSVDDRNIYSISVGTGDNIFLISAGIHAAEVANTMYTMKYIIDLVNLYENNNKQITELLEEIKIVLIPSVNPDGYEVSLFGVDSIKNRNLYIYQNRENITFETYKANANGIDLNRNLPSQHGGLYYKDYDLLESVSNKPTIGLQDHYPGKKLGSEPETKALIYWLNKYINNSYAYIDVHSAGRVIFSGKPNLSKLYNTNSFKLAEIVSEINKYRALNEDDEEVGYGNDGTVTDFASEIASGFKFSRKTGRLSANYYINPTIIETDIGIITLETMEEYTFDLKIIKDEYYKKRLDEVFTNLINIYKTKKGSI